MNAHADRFDAANRAYASLVALTADLEPAHTVWRATDLARLTLDQITLVRDARPIEFGDKFAKVADDMLPASELLDYLTKPPIVLQARVLSALEWAARQVLFDDAVEEAGRREYDAEFGADDERMEQAYQRGKGETL